MKAIFVKRIDGKFCHCPFVGYRANNVEEFKSIIKKYFNKETGYPGLVFSTNDRHVHIIFSGHQYVHGEGGRWTIFDDRIHDALDENNDWISCSETVFNLLEDATKVDNEVKMLSNIINAQGGLTIQL